MTLRSAPNSPSICFRTGYKPPHGGHSKSPNSSRVTNAFAEPRTCGGSAPGTGDDAGAAGAPDPGFVNEVAGIVAAPVLAFFMYQTAPSALPKTNKMITKGSIRFISSNKNKCSFLCCRCSDCCRQ